jgi:MOSC domain-containing protein
MEEPKDMNASELVGTVGALWRFPVKSMLGEELDAVDVTEGGIVGDRAYALVDRETGKVVSAKHPKVWPDLLRCRASFVESPRPGEPLPAARIGLADGTSVMSDAPDVDAVLSSFFGRGVELARAAPDDFTIDQYHPDQENLDPQGHRDEVTEAKLGAALFNEMGIPSAVPEGAFFDVFPISVLTTSTLDHLNELQPQSTFDVRRFRMNVILATPARGFVENAWIGRALDIGDGVKLGVAMPDPRCVMTTVAQEGLEKDPQVLKALARHNRLDVAGGGLYPCAGVYAVVATTGAIHKGDHVTLS